VREVWHSLGLDDLVLHVCEREDQGSSVLESLLRDRSAKAPLLDDTDGNDLIAILVWSIWWACQEAFSRRVDPIDRQRRFLHLC
jgi:hypothetical protein